MGIFNRGKDRSPMDAAPPPAPRQTGTPIRNDRVLEALSMWAGRKDEQTFAEVLRRAVAGDLLLDITDSKISDARSGLGVGDTIVINSQRDNSGKHLLVAFTDNESLAQFRGQPGTSLGQPASATLEQAASTYDGLAINPGSDGTFIAYTSEIRQYFPDGLETAGRLVAPSIDHSMPFPFYVRMLADSPLYTSYEAHYGANGKETDAALSTATAADGGSCLILGTSPAELRAWDVRLGVGSMQMPRLARIAVDREMSGIVVNPAGPAVFIDTDTLKQVAG